MCSAATPRTLTRTYRCRQRGLYAATPRATSTSVDSTEAAKIFTSDGEVVPRRLVTLPNSGAEATSPNVWPMARFLWLSWTGLTHLASNIPGGRERLLQLSNSAVSPRSLSAFVCSAGERYTGRTGTRVQGVVCSGRQASTGRHQK